MKQLEIQFFWPLTEQLKLDLDFSECDKPVLSTTINNSVTSGQILTHNGSNLTWTTTFNIDNVTFKSEKKISWLGRKLYNIMGLVCQK